MTTRRPLLPRLAIIKDPQHDEPGVTRVERAIIGIGQPPIHRNRYVLHGYGVIDVPADYAELALVARDDDVAMAGEAV